VATGGRAMDRAGWYYEPSVIFGVGQTDEIVQREVFGPVLTLQEFADEDEAVRLANSTRYGLSAMVFTSDAARASLLGDQIRAGTIWINTFLVRDLTAPFGGCGASGIGREGGDYALDFYSELKTVQVREDTTNG
jgi:acyl-CoA reductase-like NAD-dependent aldehyde dehydrogenase